MKTRAALLAGVLGSVVYLFAASQPTLQRTANGEVVIQHTTAPNLYCRIETSTDLASWSPLMTLLSPGTLTHTDSAAPYFSKRFYRVQELAGTGHLTGDHLTTTAGDVVIHPLYHASLVMSWNGKTIYSDPDDDPAYESRYAGLPKADLILITHEHGDHYSAPKIGALLNSNAVVVVPQRVFDMLSFAPYRTAATVLNYGATTNVMGIDVQAVPGYNSNHSFGVNNCYVLTIGGQRIFISGDTGDVPEIRAVPNIDVALVCMNVFTMTVAQAASVVRAMRPKVVFPYHYRNSPGVFADVNSFKQQVGTDLGIEVRLRAWY
jgi:L-ascorbate metabolism protein UlaG (beta-lactamase superfamily)